jgi:hypothetical protein
MKREELMMVLASYLLQEQGIVVAHKKHLDEVIEQNHMREVAREDLMVEILNSRERLGIV